MGTLRASKKGTFIFCVPGSLGFSVLQLRGWNIHQVSLKQALAYAVSLSFLSTYCVPSPLLGARDRDSSDVAPAFQELTVRV